MLHLSSIISSSWAWLVTIVTRRTIATTTVAAMETIWTSISMPTWMLTSFKPTTITNLTTQTASKIPMDKTSSRTQTARAMVEESITTPSNYQITPTQETTKCTLRTLTKQRNTSRTSRPRAKKIFNYWTKSTNNLSISSLLKKKRSLLTTEPILMIQLI